MKNRGQVALEFILIILIIVIYLFTVTKPIIENSQGAIEDIENVSRASNEAQKITNSINKVAMLANGSKDKVSVFVPKNSKIICDSEVIKFESQINETGANPTISICKENICDKNFPIRNNVTLDCQITELLFGRHVVDISKVGNEVVIEEGLN